MAFTPYSREPPAMEGTMLIVSPSLVRVFSLSRKRISSSFRYTFTKLRILPSSVYRCLRSSAKLLVRLPSASPTVAALHSMLDCFPVNWRSGVGIKTFTAIKLAPPRLGRIRPAAPTKLPYRLLFNLRKFQVGQQHRLQSVGFGPCEAHPTD